MLVGNLKVRKYFKSSIIIVCVIQQNIFDMIRIKLWKQIYIC